MRTYREFISEAQEVDIFGRSPEEAARMDASDSNEKAAQRKRNKEIRDKFRQGTYQKTGQTRTPPSGGGTKPPANQQKPPENWKSKAGTGLRRGVAGLGAVGHASAGEYPEAGIAAAMGSRRLSKAIPQAGRIAVQKAAAKVGQRQAGKIASRFVPGLQQAYGIASGTRALARGDKLGAALGYASAIPGPVGWAAVGADVARETMPSSWKQAIKDKTGITRLQQSKGLENKAIQSGQGLTGVARAQQTMASRDARQVAAKAGTYGATKGSALTGLGKDTKVDKKSGTLTSQGKTVKLASTQLVRDPKTGQQRVGDLAYKGGKAVYLARPSVSSRDTSLVAKIGRGLNIGKYSKSAEQQAAKQEYRTALKNTQAYTKGLGISTKSATAQKLPGYGKK